MIQRLFAIGLGCATIVAAQDPVLVSPDYKPEIDNNWVRVLRVKRSPHGKTPMHQHPASVLVFLTGYHQKVTGADGKVQEITRKAGDVTFTEAVKHCRSGAGPIFHHERLAELGLQLLGKDPCRGIDGTTCGDRNHHCDRPGRVGLPVCRPGS